MMSEKKERHGGPYDRGSADSYYRENLHSLHNYLPTKNSVSELVHEPLNMTTSHHSSNHEAEWLYSTAISHTLSPLNKYIHNISSVPHPIELFIAFCGYAFNPVMFPLWPI